MEYFINMTISAIVSGIIVAAYEAFLNKRFKKIETKYEMLISANKELYNIALQRMEEIWVEIEKAEEYLRNGINSQIRKATEEGANKIIIDYSTLKSAYDVINQKSALMPSILTEKTKELFQYYENVHNGYINLANKVINSQATLDDLNRYIPEMMGRKEYVEKKEELKITYYERIKSLLFENIK